MNVTEIKTETGRYDTKVVRLTVKPCLEDFAPIADADLVNQLVGRTWVISIRQRHLGDRSSQYYAKTRVYAETPADVNLGMDQPPYGSSRGDGSDEDKAWRKYNRLEMLAGKTLIRFALPLISALTKGPADPAVKFSRFAGCSCPCSPGYILNSEQLTRYAGSPCDIWISTK